MRTGKPGAKGDHTMEKLHFGRNTHNLIDRGIRALESIDEQLEELNGNLEADDRDEIVAELVEVASALEDCNQSEFAEWVLEVVDNIEGDDE